LNFSQNEKVIVFVFYLIIITFSSIFCEQILSAHVGFDTFL